MVWLFVKKFGVWVIMAVILGWTTYAGIIRPVTKPNPSNKQEGRDDNYHYEIRQTFGCVRFPSPEEK